MIKTMVKSSLRVVFYAACVYLLLPFIGGLYYTQCGDRCVEQAWLNKVIAHCREMRIATTDPDLRRVLGYVMTRYNRIGPWDVMIAPLITTRKGSYTVGMNQPWCPGITLDSEVLTWSPEDGAVLVAHEALHDFRPFFGHKHINDRERKLYELSESVK
jgi:hypothetical protein